MIDLCPLRRVLNNFTVSVDYMCSANPAIKTNRRKTKTLFKKITTTLRSLNGGQKMPVGACFHIHATIVSLCTCKRKIQKLFESLQCPRIQFKLRGAT